MEDSDENSVDDSLTLWMESIEPVSVSGYNQMHFMIWPKRNEWDEYRRWMLKLTLLDDEDPVGIKTFTYGSLTEATTDAEALAVYLQSTTDAPHIQPQRVGTQFPQSRIR